MKTKHSQLESELLNALVEISRGEGAYDFNPATHAANCIENMKEIANQAIKKATS